MQRVLWLLLGVIVMAATVGVAAVRQLHTHEFTEQTLINGAKFSPAPCWFDTDNAIAAQCGWFNTAPISTDNPATFRLPVVILKHTGKPHYNDPLVYLAGGPGSSAWLDKQNIENYWLEWFKQKQAINRDLILFDQRGTGMSEPAITCEDYRTLSATILTHPNTPTQNAERYRQISEQCKQKLITAKMPLDQLGTEYSAQDVNDLLETLHYSKVNLFGISYGTRLALEVQKRFPDRVRTLTLDSLYPPGEHLFRDWPHLLDQSLQRIFNYCETHEKCKLENGDVSKRYQELMAKLRTQPISINVESLNINGLTSLQLNDEILLAVLFDAQYISNNLAHLPDMLRYLQEGKIELARQHIENYLRHQFDEAFREPVFWSVECHDNPTIPRSDMEAQLDTYPNLRYYLPQNYNVCDIWGKASNTNELQAAIKNSSTPSLILAGEDDPITPANWAVKAASDQFPAENTYLFRFANTAHSVLDSKSCATDLLAHFLQNPEERPHADCRFDSDNPATPKHISISTDEELNLSNIN